MDSFSIILACSLHILLLPIQTSAGVCSRKPGYMLQKSGCRVDTHRSLALLFDDRASYDDTNPGSYMRLVCKCMEASMNKSHMWFAVESTGLCLCKGGTLSSYLAEYPLDADNTCKGQARVKSNRTDINGNLCVGGKYRAVFYMVKSSVSGDGSDQRSGSVPLEGTLEGPLEAPLAEIKLSCSNKSDVAFYVDVSGSIGPDKLLQVIKYIKKFLDRFDFTAGKTRLAVAEFDDTPRVKLSLKGSAAMKLDDIHQIISTISSTGKSTRTDLALDNARKLFAQQQRDGVPRTLVLVTDGRSWLDKSLLDAAVKGLKDLKVKILAIAVGRDLDLDLDNLVNICGSIDRVIKLREYYTLLSTAAATLNQLVETACTL